MNGTLHTTGGRSVLRFERRLRHPVEKVWRAVTDAAEMAHWFPAIVDMDLREGGKIQFAFPGGEMDGGDGLITELDPPRVFAFTWNGDPLRIELRPDGDGTLLIFTHTFDDRPMAGSFATGWETCLGALEKSLAGEAPAGPGRPERYAERHDAYLAAFGLDEGTTSEDAEGFTVRFERLLPHPLEKVWPQLTESARPAIGGEPPLRLTNESVPAGALTEVRDDEEHKVLEYAWSCDGEPAGRVRWELTGGHPAGTRLVLTQRGPARLAAGRVEALAAWHTQLELFADHLRGSTRCRLEGRTEELTKHYAELVEAR